MECYFGVQRYGILFSLPNIWCNNFAKSVLLSDLRSFVGFCKNVGIYKILGIILLFLYRFMSYTVLVCGVKCLLLFAIICMLFIFLLK